MNQAPILAPKAIRSTTYYGPTILNPENSQLYVQFDVRAMAPGKLLKPIIHGRNSGNARWYNWARLPEIVGPGVYQAHLGPGVENDFWVDPDHGWWTNRSNLIMPAMIRLYMFDDTTGDAEYGVYGSMVA
jgi:hypothetical protein